MKKLTLLIAILSCLLLPSRYLMQMQVPLKAAQQQVTNEPQAESPRLKQLKAQVAGGDRAVLSRFWKAMAAEHTPLIEPIPNEPGKVLVTFLWRAAPGTTGVMVMGRQMTRLLETDLWFTTLTMDPSIPIFYAFFPVITGEAARRAADPLNPHRFVMPAETQAALPPDVQAIHAWCQQTSMLLFRENPAERWTEVEPSTPKGKIEMFTVEDKKRAKSRRVWVYTPPNYNSKSSVPCRLLICFDGPSYLAEIPVPTILNNFLPRTRFRPQLRS